MKVVYRKILEGFKVKFYKFLLKDLVLGCGT